MTKNAQHALRYLIQQYSKNVRFCLICNYISRIDNSLQNEFIKLRFSQLPSNKIYDYLKNIIEKENIDINAHQINSIQHIFNSDIRSMINYLQSNHNNIGLNIKIISDERWKLFLNLIKNNPEEAINLLNIYSKEYHETVDNLIIHFVSFLLKDENFIKNEVFKIVKYTLHHNVNSEYSLKYLIYSLNKLFEHISS